jgi:4-amino-4-deoxy-L-arabinose transferase-like glycosyltransferase
MWNLSNKNLIFYFSAVVLLSASIFFHLLDLGKIPAGMHCDESSLAYNAYSIVKTGCDEYGNRYPLFFRCFGNYQDPVMAYTIVPFIKMFGMEKWAVRLPSALYHIFASLAFYFLAYYMVRRKYPALACAFVFSLLPWIFPISRLGIGGFTAVLFFLIAGLYFLFKGIAGRSYLFSVLSGVFLAASMYSHHAGKPTTALTLVLFVSAFNFTLLKRWRYFLSFVGCFVLSLVPMMIYVYGNPVSMTSRFNTISVWRDNPGLYETVIRIIERYFYYFSPQFLFISGDANVAHSTQYAGTLFLFLLPFIIAGIYRAIRYFKANPFYRFIILALIGYPTAAMLTIGFGHSTCCINGTVYFMLLALLGFSVLWRKRKKFGIILAISLALSVCEIPYYLHTYFNKYDKSSRWIFNAAVFEAVQKSMECLGKGDTFYVSHYVFYPEEIQDFFKPEFYTNMLFLLKVDPGEFQRTGHIPEKIASLYYGKAKYPGILLTVDTIAVADGNSLKPMRNFEKLPDKRNLITKIPTPSGISFEIYRIQGSP